jgi:P27 family predicted phage terminase small subunit
MGRRGPKSKPTKLKKALGNPGRRPLNEREPEPTGFASIPDYLDDYAIKVWKRIIIAMPEGVYTACDTETLGAYCSASSLLRKAVKICNGVEPLPAKTSEKDWINIQKQQAHLLCTIGTRLGLDPSARTAIKVPDKPKTGKFGKIRRVK